MATKTKIEDLLKQLKLEFIKVNLIQSSLDSIIFFLVSNLFLFVISLDLIGNFENYLVLGGFTITFFFFDLYYRVKSYHLELYEEKNPSLEEALRTARDNIDKSNTVSEALFKDVKSKTRKITSESIIPSRRIIEKIVLIGLLCFLTVGSGIASFQLSSPERNLLDNLDIPFSEDQKVDERNVSILDGEDILEKANNPNVEPANLGLQIEGSGASGNKEFNMDVPAESLSFSSTEGRTPENLELAKKYSLEIKKFD
ncbi:hypothetical protein GLU64_02795 [Nanohaloarchaea archaeon]|nr:hypothetical protein [Candidatus Nanohaloarchaea archaeon]